MRSWSYLAGATAFAVLASCADFGAGGSTAVTEQDEDTLAAAGRDVAVRECASCHAIDQDMISPLASAPPMRTLLSRYEPDMLANDLIEGIRVGHDEMPLFDFNVAAADSLIAYLKSIDRRRLD